MTSKQKAYLVDISAVMAMVKDVIEAAEDDISYIEMQVELYQRTADLLYSYAKELRTLNGE